MIRMFTRLAMKTAKAAKVPAFYAVRRGRNPGIYSTWAECESEVKGFVGARFKKFLTVQEAQDFIDGIDAAGSSKKDTSDSKPDESSDKATKKTSKAKESDKPAKETAKAAESKPATGSKRSAILLPDDFHASEAKKPKDGPVSVYTDGCCFNNGKDNPCGGVGVYWGPGDPNNLSERLTGRQTNNRAEIFAAMRAIQQAKKRGITELQIYTDSIFLINCMTKWVTNWKKKGWVSSNGKEVLNREELELLDAETEGSGITVTYVHVPGHNGVEGNEAADKLANEGARKKAEPEEK